MNPKTHLYRNKFARMRKSYILFLICTLGFAIGMKAQQDPQYSQYMFNHLSLNPAYAGSWDHLTTTFLFRKQWTGVNGAPNTGSFTLHTPSRNRRHGFGVSFYHDEIGVAKTTSITVPYAFRMDLGGNARLALGIQGNLTNYNADLSGVRTGSDIEPGVPVDPAFNGNLVNVWLPNAGAGIFFNTKRFYLGASAPRLIEGALTEDENISDAKQARHYFFTTGLVLGADNAAVKFKPSILAKYHPAAPMQFDFNAHFLFVDKFWLGASFRTEDAIVFMAEWQISPLFRIGYAYDLTTSELNTYSNGSHEFMLGLDLNFNKKAMISPRYF